MKVFVSKYAITDGITEHDATISGDGGYASVPGRLGLYTLKMGRDAHLTREEAVAKAHEMRMRRIASLQKQIAKLEQMTFEQTERR